MCLSSKKHGIWHTHANAAAMRATPDNKERAVLINEKRVASTERTRTYNTQCAVPYSVYRRQYANSDRIAGTQANVLELLSGAARKRTALS